MAVQASADDLPLTVAILAGSKKRYAATKVPTVLIHTVRFMQFIHGISILLTEAVQSGTGQL